MGIKLILLVLLAAVVWLMTSSFRRSKKIESELIKCAHCGVYHNAAEKCECRKNREE